MRTTRFSPPCAEAGFLQADASVSTGFDSLRFAHLARLAVLLSALCAGMSMGFRRITRGIAALGAPAWSMLLFCMTFLALGRTVSCENASFCPADMAGTVFRSDLVKNSGLG